MARSCPQCGKYLGAALQCRRCTGPSSPASSPARPRRAALPPSSQQSPTAPLHPSPGRTRASGRPRHPGPRPTPARSGQPGRSGFFSIRGEVVAGSRERVAWAWGVLPVRIVLWLATAVLFFVKGRDLAIRELAALLILLWPYLLLLVLASWVLSKLHLKGCMGALLGAAGSILGAGLRIGTEAASRRSRPGWRLTVDHAGGSENVRIAADAPIDEGQVVQVHGPRLGAVRDAWLVQGIAPLTFTRLGRGLVSTLVLALVLVPVCVWLLTL